MKTDRFPWLKDARCLVTGGAGFIGSHLAAHLVQAGARVTILDDFSTGSRTNLAALGGEYRLIEGSITDENTVREATGGVEYVFHLGAIPAVPRSIEDPLGTGYVNIWGTQLVLEYARRAGAKRFVHSASSSAYGDTAGEGPRSEELRPTPISPYAAHKLAGEHLVRAYARSMGFEALSLRYFNIFGPRQNPDSPYSAVIPLFVRAALQSKPIVIHGDGLQSRDFAHVDNAVLANILATRPACRVSGEVLNVGCGTSFSLLTLVEQIASYTGTKPEVTHTESRPGDVRFSCADISAIREQLGFEVAVPFQEGLRRTIEAMQAESR